MPPRDELSLCAQVSLRYEMPYLLPWLAYHTLLGFDRILLYLDDLSHLGLIDAGEQGRVLKTLARASHVTVLRMSAHNMTGPGDQMQHCVWSARKHAVWMAMWDIDEVAALGQPPTALPRADEARRPPSLKQYLRALPNRTAGVLVTRVPFDCNGHEAAPPSSLLEYEAFTRRSCDAMAGGGKVLWRSDARGTGVGVRPDTFHTLAANRRSALSDPDGRVVADWSRCCNNSTDFGWWRGGASAAVAPGGALTPAGEALRLHHYVTRSVSECRKKKVDQNHPGSVGWGHAWRAGPGSQGLCNCGARRPCDDDGDDARSARDLSLAQYGPAVRRETERLFGVRLEGG